MDKRINYYKDLRKKALLFRISSHIAIAALAILLPAVGENRFLVAAALLCFGTPTAILVNRRIKGVARNWAEALVDLIIVLTLIHLTPHLWMVGMALGLMVALAPSISLHPMSHWIYMGFGALLILGMTLVAIVHDVENWELVILGVSVSYPALLFYTYAQMQSANELRKRAGMVRGMTQMAGSMAHDFNNMLMAISGHTEIALSHLTPEHDARTNLEKVLEGTKRASLLTNRLLSFAGRDIGQKESINVTAEFTAISELLQPALPAGISLKLSGADKPLYVKANVSDLHQVWMNVLMNAGESMEGEQGAIEVDFSRTKSQGNNEPNQITMLISDRGSGIAQQALDKVFDPFFTTKEKGHGLGLAVTKRIMQQLNGDIVIRSRSGGGAEVLITFPEAQTPSQDATQTHDFDELLSRDKISMTILVVDDEPDVRSAAEGLLTSLGHKACLAINADEAISIFAANHEHISIVMLDLKMPGRDGWSCLKDLREIAPNKPVIICSGFNPIETLPDFAVNDANLHFLAKPFQSDLLAEALAKIQ